MEHIKISKKYWKMVFAIVDCYCNHYKSENNEQFDEYYNHSEEIKARCYRNYGDDYFELRRDNVIHLITIIEFVKNITDLDETELNSLKNYLNELISEEK